MEESTQFLVQWDEHPSHLATRLGYLLEHQSLVDVTLMCNTHTLKVHRAVLAACSPYFERQLGNHPLIVLKDMKFSVLKSLVEFMYCGETSVSEENLSSLLEAAKFFEVKGLSSMTKESVRGPNSSNAIKSFNGPVTPTTSSSYGRNCGGRGGRGRGRGRPPINPTTKIGSPTESAQILLSLSGNTAAAPSPQLYTTSKNVKIDPTLIQQQNSMMGSGGVGPSPGPLNSTIDKSKMVFEPRRRGRKRGGGVNTFRALRGTDNQLAALETLKRDLSDDSDPLGSPLLNSLLTKPEGKKASSAVVDPNDSSKYFQALKEIGLPTNVPILMDNGEGKYVTLNEDVLKSVIESDGNLQFQLTDSPIIDSQGFLNQVVTTEKKEMEEKILNKQKKPVKQFVVKEMQISRSDDEEKEMMGCKIKTETSDETDLNEALIENIKNGAANEAEMVPDAVVLFEVTDDKKIEKYVVSAKEVSMLKALNEQLTKQKKELADITRNAKIDVVGTNTKVAELKLRIGRTKSILSKFINCTHGLQERLKNVAKTYMNGNTDPNKLTQSQVVQLEFIDGNGEKIEGYQVQGTVLDKRLNESKEVVGHKDNDLLGLFDIVCSGSEGAILEKKGGKGGATMLGGGEGEDVSLEAKEISYQMVMNNNLTDHHETINYDQIEAMIEDPAGNIVIEDKNQDLKYIIDNEGNLMNHDENYVVYEEDKGDLGASEYVIYDNHDGVMPDMTDGDSSRGFVVGAETEVIQNDDGTEYIVYDGGKGGLSDHIKEMSDGDVGSQYIVYTSEEAMEKPTDESGYDGMESDDLSKEHQEYVINEGDMETVIVKEELPETNGEVGSMESGGSPVKDVPFAVGLLPLKDALEKFQSISEHQPRKTRSNSIGSRRRSSVNSDSSDRSMGSKKMKLDPTLAENVDGESL